MDRCCRRTLPHPYRFARDRDRRASSSSSSTRAFSSSSSLNISPSITTTLSRGVHISAVSVSVESTLHLEPFVSTIRRPSYLILSISATTCCPRLKRRCAQSRSDCCCEKAQRAESRPFRFHWGHQRLQSDRLRRCSRSPPRAAIGAEFVEDSQQREGDGTVASPRARAEPT